QRDRKESGARIQLEDMSLTGILNDFIDKRREQKAIRLKESIGRYLIVDISHLHRDAHRSFNEPVRQDKARNNLRCAERMNFCGGPGVDRRDELIQFGYKGGTFPDRTIDESQPAVKHVKCCAETVVAIGTGDAMNFAVPIEMSDSLQALPDDRFLV